MRPYRRSVTPETVWAEPTFRENCMFAAVSYDLLDILTSSSLLRSYSRYRSLRDLGSEGSEPSVATITHSEHFPQSSRSVGVERHVGSKTHTLFNLSRSSRFRYLFAVGGFDAGVYMTGVDRYDPGTNSWVPDVAHLPDTGRANFCAVDVHDVLWILGGSKYVVGPDCGRVHCVPFS